SGRRSWLYLEAAWRVASVRSWWSRRASKGMSFEVITYTSTSAGLNFVRSHASSPRVWQVTGCPTIGNSFNYAERNDIKKLCRNRNPDKSFPALGFNDTGALIAFAHGAPNNCPACLFKSGKG